MRPKKFLGKRIDNGLWVYGFWGNRPDGANFICPFENYESHAVIPESVGQFTGLLDKNNVEAYEKDYDDDGNMIDWCDRCCGYQFFQIDQSGDIIYCHNCEGNFMLQEHIGDFEIIGHIYELLTDKQKQTNE